MAVVAPFAGLRYDAATVGDVGAVLAPPYDVISAEEQAALYDRSPWNAVRLILARGEERAASAAATLRAWTREGVLRSDPEPALYLYSQTFRMPDGAERRRDGVICRLRLEDFSSGVVRAHERTFPGPKQDRLALMRATGAYLSPIFGLYARPGERVRSLLGEVGSPAVDATGAGGGHHRLWRVTDPAPVARFLAALAAETIFIADGHHRYETGLAYRDELGGAGDSAWIMACLVNMEEDGLVVLPTHRLVSSTRRIDAAVLAAGVEDRFTVEPLGADTARPDGVIDVVLPDAALRLRPAAGAARAVASLPAAVRDLAVTVLREAVLAPLGIASDALAFTHDDAEARDAVATGRASAAFLMNPPSMAAIRRVCLSGEVMPEKSTYFFPKLADGLVFDLVGPPWR
jgi:uncharacterized protein (DUF1015 family)